MDSSQGSLPVASQEMPPPGFVTIDQVRNLPNEKIAYGSNKKVPLVNVIGLLRDFQPPRRTGGTGRHCGSCAIIYIDTIHRLEMFFGNQRLFYLGITGYEDTHILARRIENAETARRWRCCYRSEDKSMYTCSLTFSSLLMVLQPQMNYGVVDLLANRGSEFHVMSASKLPIALSAPGQDLWQSYPPVKCVRPTAAEIAYVIKTSGNAEALDLPSPLEFEQKAMQAMRVKTKDSLLRDVEADQFYDLLGEVIQIYGEGDPVTLYLSDYTANSMFYDHARGEKSSDGRDGDEYNYIKSRKKADAKEWPGPFGKMAMQLTLWDSHAAFVRGEVEVGQWILLRNVQVKHSKSGGLLEGALRGDRNSFEGKVQVEIMRKSEDLDSNNVRWKEGVKRKYEYEKKSKQQWQKLQEGDAASKRKRVDEPSKLNAKQRRKEKRAALETKDAAQKSKTEDRLDLNRNSRSFPAAPQRLLIIFKSSLITPSKWLLALWKF